MSGRVYRIRCSCPPDRLRFGKRSATRTIQLLEVARNFYIDEEPKVAIAKRMGISRFAVSRLLEQARSTGLVRIDIRPPADVDFALSSALMKKAGLRRAIVLPATDPASELAILADAAASYMIEAGAPKDVVGLVAGRTTSRILDRIGELPGRSIVQLSGVSRTTHFEHNPAEMIRAMAMRFRGQTFPIYAPLLLADAALVASLREQIGIADSIAQFQKLTRVLFSVGAGSRTARVSSRASTRTRAPKGAKPARRAKSSGTSSMRAGGASVAPCPSVA